MAAQYSSPTGDQTTGLWSPSPLWDQVNEFVQNSGDLISSSSYPTGDTCEMILSGLSAPTDKTAHTLSYYYQANDYDTNYKLDLTVGLYQGSTLISGTTYTGITTGWLSGSINLTTGQAATISNYNDLRVRFTAQTGVYPLAPDILWWKLNEGAGIAVADTSTSGTNSGILQSANMWVPGKLVTGISGNASTFFARTSGNITMTKPVITLSFWMYSTGWGGAIPELFELSPNANSNADCFTIYHDNKIHAFIQSNGYRSESASVPSVNAWHHYSFILNNDSTVGDVRIFIDAAEQNTTLDLNSKTTSGNYKTDVLYVMTRGNTQDWAGEVLDDIRIYGRALTSGEILQVYNDPR